jgi:hypothetical protein
LLIKPIISTPRIGIAAVLLIRIAVPLAIPIMARVTKVPGYDVAFISLQNHLSLAFHAPDFIKHSVFSDNFDPGF